MKKILHKWIIGALCLMTLGFVVVAGYTLYKADIALIVTDATSDQSELPPKLLMTLLKSDLFWKLKTQSPHESPDGLLELTMSAYVEVKTKQAQERAIQLFDLFLSRGANIDGVRNHSGLPPLYSAILFRNPKLVEHLISKGANVNLRPVSGPAKGMTPVAFAKNLALRMPGSLSDLLPIIEIIRSAGGK